MFSFYREDAEKKGEEAISCWRRLWRSWADLLPYIPRAVDLGGAVGDKTSSTYGRGAGQRQFTHIECAVPLTDADLAHPAAASTLRDAAKHMCSSAAAKFRNDFIEYAGFFGMEVTSSNTVGVMVVPSSSAAQTWHTDDNPVPSVHRGAASQG